ncbi:ubiquitin-protein ligase E3C-like [Convolutriloba macropyga]|uniref:ubiquitin-protein ligase E3C-like n=1 Tax=Convolutriloba macropyga TaxID=536237 RepID=UPI003F52824E
MYSFTGTYKSSPQVSLGNYQSASARDIVNASRKAREKREKSRNVERATIKLQAWARASLCRVKLRRSRRLELEFILNQSDSTNSQVSTLSQANLCQLVYLMRYVFEPQHDTPLWVHFTRHLMSFKASFVTALKERSSNGWTYFIGCLIYISKRHIEYCAVNNGVMTASLRILEFLSKNDTLSLISSTSASSEENAVIHGLFSALTTAWRLKMPSSIYSYMESGDDDGELDLYRRSEMYKFVLQILKAMLSYPETSDPTSDNLSAIREIALLQELYIGHKSNESIWMAVVLNTDIATLLNRRRLIVALETVLLKVESDELSCAKITLLINLVLKSLPTNGMASNVEAALNVSKLDRSDMEKLMFVMSQLIHKYASYIVDLVGLDTNRKQVQMVGMHEDSDSDDDDENGDNRKGEQRMFSGFEEHLIDAVSKQLESQEFCSQLMPSLAQAVVANSSSEKITLHFCSLIYSLHRINAKSRALFLLPSMRGLLKQIWRTITSTQGQSLSGQKMSMLQQLKSAHLLPSGETIRPIDYTSHMFLPTVASFCRLTTLLLITVDDKELFDANSGGLPFTQGETLNIITHLKDAALGLIEIIHPESGGGYGMMHRSQGFSSSNGSSNSGSSKISHLQRCSIVLKLVCQLLRQLHERDQRVGFSSSEGASSSSAAVESHDFWISNKCAIPKEPNDVTICEALRRGVDLEQILSTSYTNLSSGTQQKIAATPVRTAGIVSGEDDVSGQNNILSVVSMRDRRLLVVLTSLAFLISFPKRIKLFRKILHLDKMEVEDRSLPMGVSQNQHFGDIAISIRRTHVYEDAFDYLSLQNERDLRRRIKVTWRNFTGVEEAGIDGGGLTRDFLQELIKAAFDPKLGFFTTTPEGAFYPFPQVTQLMDVSAVKQHFFFIGRMVGKVLYENLLVELPLAPFFLAKILSGQVDINYLASLDPELHQNLLSLKAYKGNVEDLTLTFARDQEVLGNIQAVELIPDGANVVVDNANRLFYMHTVADYWLNRQIRTQHAHFLAGLTDLISLNWLRMFNPTELQTLISGASVSIDVDDMRRNAVYAGSSSDSNGAFSDSHPYIESFWQIVESWDDKRKAELLKFITSCSRPPLLGFKEVFPPIAIHSAGPSEDRLPTASVCMNVLKLPIFPSKEVLEQKLIMAVDSKSGFELS